MNDTPGHLFCFGLGYCALALSRTLRAEGWRVSGTCRAEDRRAKLAARGIAAHVFDRGHPLADPDAAFAGVTHVLHSVAPDAEGDPVLRQYGMELAQLPSLRWFGYLSTTGVYGDRGGDWVDEESELKPTGERGRRRVAAEAGWGALVSVGYFPLHIFRLAGIYGPRRNPLVELRKGTAKRIVKPGQVFSRIHVADIVQVLRASMARPFPGAVYNVCDDDPAPPGDVVEYAAELLGVAPPPAVPFEQAEMSEMARSFYDDSKRVRNERIKRMLGVQLQYPSYREGLRALAQPAPREQPLQILRPAQPVIAVLDEGHDDVGAGQPFREPHARRPGHVWIGHAVEQAHGATDVDGRAQQQVPPPVLDQGAADLHRRVLVLRRPQDRALGHEPRARRRRHLRPHQVLGEVGRRGDADEAGDPVRPGQGDEQHDPAAHAGADEDLRPGGEAVERGQRIVRPASDRAVAKDAARPAVAGIIEAQRRLPALAAPGLQGHALGPAHVGGEAGQEDDARAPVAAARRETAIGQAGAVAQGQCLVAAVVSRAHASVPPGASSLTRNSGFCRSSSR